MSRTDRENYDLVVVVRVVRMMAMGKVRTCFIVTQGEEGVGKSATTTQFIHRLFVGAGART